MKHNITKLEEGNESGNFVLGNYLTELELRYHASDEASSMTDTQPDLLQGSQADEIDCNWVDVVSVSKIAELDHGQVSHVCNQAQPLDSQVDRFLGVGTELIRQWLVLEFYFSFDLMTLYINNLMQFYFDLSLLFLVILVCF